MKIAFASDNAYPWFNGGIEKRRFLIAQQFVRAGHEVHFFTMRQRGMDSSEFSKFGVNYHCTADATEAGKLYKNGRRSITLAIKHSFLTFFKMLNYRFDAIDCDAFPFFNVVLLKAYSTLTGAKMAVTWYETWSREYWQSYLGAAKGMVGYCIEMLAAMCSSRIISISSATSDSLVDIFEIKRSSITLLPAAISIQELRDMGKKPRQNNSFVVACRLIPEKRVDLAIEAMKDVDAKLLIVGKGPESGKLRDLSRRLGIEKKIEFKEALSREALFGKIRASRGLILASEREGLSLIALESIALGTPVFILGTTMVPKEVRRYCVEATDGNLAPLLSKALKTSKFSKQANANRKDVMREFSSDAALAAYEKALGTKL